MVLAVINKRVQDEIVRLAKVRNVEADFLEEFAYFVIQSYNEKTYQSSEPLSISELKKAIYNRFNVKNTEELKKSRAFINANNGIDNFNFRLRSCWEGLYRKYVGILPNEENQQGYGCINGINIFLYSKPWKVFDLDPKNATRDDLKNAYYKLAKKYHPDNSETGDRKIFEKIEIMYKSLIAGVE